MAGCILCEKAKPTVAADYLALPCIKGFSPRKCEELSGESDM
ncbi:hypothetical protein S7335_2578 [Synechococcus sp. PCC 7335]|nr:hypothetical protein S7335_2578 [Synechococcus sp. PCC 7335]